MGQACTACGLDKDADVIAQAMTLIKSVPIFSKMSDKDITKIASKMYERDYKPGEKIFGQGDEGDEFFVILSGEAEVHVEKENEEPAKFLLHGGDFFGEKALINKALRSEVNIELNFPPKLRGARSRLYRRRFLQVNTRWKALAEIYTMHSFAPFSWDPSG